MQVAMWQSSAQDLLRGAHRRTRGRRCTSSVCVTARQNSNAEKQHVGTAEGTSRRGLLAGGLVLGIPPSSLVVNPPAEAAVQLEPQADTIPSNVLKSNAGIANLRNPDSVRGLATPASARQQLGLRNLLPPAQVRLEEEVARAHAAVMSAGTPLERHRVLMSIKESSTQTFYALMQKETEALLPIVYTPTVGDACLNWGTLFPRPLGLYITPDDAGSMDEALAAWPYQDVRIAVITDGERILGLGDLGAHGMCIPTGKAMVYGTCGVRPDWVLPITVDVGCNKPGVRDSPFYVGTRKGRLRGPAYLELMDELVTAITDRYGSATVIHWEDLAASNAFAMLKRLQGRGVVTFNDDIQCTAAVTVAAMLAAMRVQGVPPLQQQRVLFFGAGQANLGTAALLMLAMQSAGMDPEQARASIWLVDSKGLVTRDREGLSPGKQRFAQGMPPGDVTRNSTLEQIIQAVQPTAIVGAAAVGGTFTQPALLALTSIVRTRFGASARPIVFALSNPTDRAECTFQQAHEWTDGAAVFASGTGFKPIKSEDGARTLRPAQANNCFIFPGVGLGTVAAGASQVTDEMLLAAAQALAGLVSEEDLAEDCVLPSTARLQEVTTTVAAATAGAAATGESSEDPLLNAVQSQLLSSPDIMRAFLYDAWAGTEA